MQLIPSYDQDISEFNRKKYVGLLTVNLVSQYPINYSHIV